MEKTYLSWNDVSLLIETLCDEIKQSPITPLYITGLPRGGVIPAIIISHRLGIPYINVENIKKYSSQDVLVIDDIADTGETLNQYRIYSTAVLHYKFSSEHIPTYYASSVEENEWIVYSWERDDSNPIQDYLT